MATRQHCYKILELCEERGECCNSSAGFSFMIKQMFLFT